MQYISTRGEAPELSFEDALLAGLARDGGVPAPDLAANPNRSPVSDPDGMLVHIVLPKVEEAVAPVEAATATPAEPEVMKKGKKEEEGADKKDEKKDDKKKDDKKK